MSEAGEVLNRLIAAVGSKGAQAVAGCYADAVAVAPDEDDTGED